MTFNTQTTASEWFKFLDHMTYLSSSFNPKPLILSKLTMFQTGASKNLWVDAAIKEGNEALVKGHWTKEERESYIENWTLGLTLTGFLHKMRSSGTLAVFTNAMGNAVGAQSQNVMDWHTYAVYYKGGILAVYDPSFVIGINKLDMCTGVSLLKALVRALRAKGMTRKITELWFGGGTNQGEHCQEVTRAWIEEQIVGKEGAELGKWEKQEGWVHLHF